MTLLIIELEGDVMKFTLYQASKFKFKDEITINSLDDLKMLSEKYNNEQLIVDFYESTIWIYDDYMES